MPAATFVTNATLPKYIDANRSIAYLSDATRYTLVHITGATLRLYSGSPPSEEATTTDNVSSTNGASRSSMTVDADDNLHIVYIGSGGDIRYLFYEPGVGFSTSEQVAAAPGAGYIGRTDIEVVDDGVVVIAWTMIAYSGGTQSFNVRARSTAPAWGTAYSVNAATASNFAGNCCSLARSSDSAISGVAIVGFMYNFSTTGTKYGRLSVDLATGAIAVLGTPATSTQYPEFGNLFTLDGRWAAVTQVSQDRGAVVNYREFSSTTGAFVGGMDWSEQGDLIVGNTNESRPAAAMIGDVGVVVNVGPSSTPGPYGYPLQRMQTRVRYPNSGFGVRSDFNVLGGGCRFIRCGANRNVPTDRLDVVHVWYSGGNYLQIMEGSDAPAAPEVVSPGVPSGVVVYVSTDRPNLVGRTVLASGEAVSRIRYQLDTAGTFAGGELEQEEGIEGYLTAGTTHSMQVTEANELYKSPWYIRCAAVNEFGAASAWSAVKVFTVLHVPSVTGMIPTGGQFFPFGTGDVTLSWTFSDPSPYDSQSAYQILIREAVSGDSVYDSGKITSTTESGAVTIDPGLKGIPLAWQVKVWDSDDEPSVPTTWHLFTMADAPVVTLDLPVDSTTWDHPSLEVEWSTVLGAGASQVEYKVDVYNQTTSRRERSTGWVRSTASTHTFSAAILERGNNYRITVSVKDNQVMVGSDFADIAVAWTPPSTPVFSVDASDFDTSGSVTIEWTNNEIDVDFMAYRVYVRPTTADGSVPWSLVGTYTENLENYVHNEFFVGSAIDFDYAVVQVAERFDVGVESEYDPVVVAAEGVSYWILDRDDTSRSIKLHHVTADSWTDEWDQEIHRLLGSGRKEDRGTRYGASGSLSCQMRPKYGRSARDQKEDLLNAKAAGRTLVLRTPFGDLMRISIGNLSVTRIAGVGVNEYVDIEIPYSEVGVT
jgi:hypothetical protein